MVRLRVPPLRLKRRGNIRDDAYKQRANSGLTAWENHNEYEEGWGTEEDQDDDENSRATSSLGAWSSADDQDENENSRAASSFATPPRPLHEEGDSFWDVDSKGLHEKSREFESAARMLRATTEWELQEREYLQATTTGFEQQRGGCDEEGEGFQMQTEAVHHKVAADIGSASPPPTPLTVLHEYAAVPSTLSYEKDSGDDGVVLGAAGGLAERFEVVLREGCDLKCLFFYATPPAGYDDPTAKGGIDGDQSGSNPGVAITDVILVLASRQTDGDDDDKSDERVAPRTVNEIVVYDRQAVEDYYNIQEMEETTEWAAPEPLAAVDLEDILFVLMGHQTPAFEPFRLKPAATTATTTTDELEQPKREKEDSYSPETNAAACCSLVGLDFSLDVVAADETERTAFVAGLAALLGFRAATPSTGPADDLSPMAAVEASRNEDEGTRCDSSGEVLKCVECSENAPPPLPLPPDRGERKIDALPKKEVGEARVGEGHGHFGGGAAIKALVGGASVLSRMDPLSTATTLLVDMVLTELMHNQPFLGRDSHNENQTDSGDGEELERPRKQGNDDDLDDDRGGGSGSDDDGDEAADDAGDADEEASEEASEEGDDLVLQSSAPSVSLLSMSYGRKVKKAHGSNAGSSFDDNEDDDTAEDSTSLSSYGSSFGSSLLGLGVGRRPRVVGVGSDSSAGDRNDNAKASLPSISDGNSNGDGSSVGNGGHGDGDASGRGAMAGTGGASLGDAEDDAIGALHRTLKAFDSRLFAGGAVELLREAGSGGGGENRGGVCRRCNDSEPRESGLLLRCEGCFDFMHPECVSALRAMQVETLLSLQRWVCKRCYRRSRRYKDYKRDVKKQRLLLPRRRKGDRSSDDDDDDDDDDGKDDDLSSDGSSRSRSSRGRREKKSSGGDSRHHSRGWESNAKGRNKSGGTKKRASGPFGWLTLPPRWRRSFREIGGFGGGYETMTLRAGIEQMLRRKGGRGGSGVDGDARFVRWSHRCEDHNCSVGHDEELVSKALRQLAIDNGDVRDEGVGRGGNLASPASSYLNSGGTVGGWADLCWDLVFAFRQQPVKTAQLLSTFVLRFLVKKTSGALAAATALLSSSRPFTSSPSPPWALSTLSPPPPPPPPPPFSAPPFSAPPESPPSSSGQLSWPPWLSAWLSTSFFSGATSGIRATHKRRRSADGNTAHWWSLSALLAKLPSLASTGHPPSHSRQSASGTKNGDSSSDDEYLQQQESGEAAQKKLRKRRKKKKKKEMKKKALKKREGRDGAKENYSDSDTGAADGEEDTASER